MTDETPADTQPRRGRPPKAEAAPDSYVPQASRKRIPLGGLVDKLQYEERNGYHQHWFKNTPARIQQAKNAGYDLVPGVDQQIAGQDEHGKPESLVLMQIPEKWYREDQALKQRRIDEQEADIASRHGGNLSIGRAET